MTPSLDLNLLQVARQAGSESTNLPDLFAVTPPRHAAHGREGDSLIIYLSMAGNSPLSAEAQSKLLEQAAHKFYKTTGSLTSAMRTVAEILNQHLLERNLRSTSVGRQGIGQMILVALKADSLYMAQAGAVHAFLATPTATQHLFDPQSSGRGLGFSQTAAMRFLQVKMNPGDFLVLATQVPASWSANSVVHPQQLGIEVLRRQLLEMGGQDFNAVIVQAQAGTGKLNWLKRRAEIPEISPTGALTQSATELPQTQTEDRRLGLPPSSSAMTDLPRQTGEINQPGIPAVSLSGTEWSAQPSQDRKLGLPPEMPAPDLPVTQETSPSSGTGLPTPEAFHPSTAPAPTDNVSQIFNPEKLDEIAVDVPQGGTEAASQPAQSIRRRTPSGPSPIAKFFSSIGNTLAPIAAAILRALRSAMGTIGSALLRLFKNLLPDADVLRLPPSMMVFIALAIPITLATIGGLVFLQRGRAQQHQVYYQKAVEEANYAATLTNPVEQRMAWQNVLGDLDKAESYTLTSQSQALRANVTASLDTLDSVKRLDYKQAIVDGLDSAVNVTRLVATATDLYLLDSNAGSVLRAIMTGRGYVIDPSFQCGPTSGPINIGPLIDIAELPPGAFENASLLAMDKNGNLLFCVVGSEPYSSTMAPPNTGLGEPSAITLDRSDLFVLDPKVNAVWIYLNMEVRQQPRLFFGDYVPKMDDVIDLAEYNDDLFLLHADGRITKCTYSGLAESPTRCDDPYSYSDNRPGRVHGPVIEDAVFSQIYFSSFPERSIYMLDPQDQSIYYFSVLLNLQFQYQPQKPVAEGKATAFAISPNRTAFLAIGNYVYYAAMP